jgi:hypothetical protein
MATKRQYFDTDFDYVLKVHFKLPSDTEPLDLLLLFDFSSHAVFFSCYVDRKDAPLDFFIQLVNKLRQGSSELLFNQRVTLPSARQFHGELRVKNENPLEIQAKFYADISWISIKDIQLSKRVFIYSETELPDGGLEKLKQTGAQCGYEVQFRSKKYAMEREKIEKPLAFISHDSRDKDAVARPTAIGLHKMICPVWYDEFSLKVGDHLRESIEDGLKKCKKCILILSQNFLSNNGWTKKEFDSIFTREILEEKKLVLPVWCGVNKEQIYEYSPSLLNVVGINWSKGEDEVIRKLHNSIVHSEVTFN